MPETEIKTEIEPDDSPLVQSRTAPPPPPPTLSEIAADHAVCSAIREAILPVWQAEFRIRDADCAQGYLGSVCYHRDVQKLTKALRAYGWERRDFENQVRWLNRERYSRPVQLVTSRAIEENGNYRVSAKGFASQFYTGQLELGYDEYAHIEVLASDNYWILIDLLTSPLVDEMPHWFKIVIAHGEFEGRTRLMVQHEHLVYDGRLYPDTSSGASKPWTPSMFGEKA